MARPSISWLALGALALLAGPAAAQEAAAPDPIGTLMSNSSALRIGVDTVWVLLCASDFVDGFIARRRGPTASGAFLDPLADKVLVLGAMFALVANGTFWWLPVAIITVRELGIQAFRTYWGKRGLAVPATPIAKAKTVVQEVAVGFALLPLTADDHTWVANAALAAALVLTVWSGVQYLQEGSRAARTTEPARPAARHRELEVIAASPSGEHHRAQDPSSHRTPRSCSRLHAHAPVRTRAAPLPSLRIE